MQNGKCGYVLMPDCMFEPGFNPMDTTTHTGCTPITLTIQIIGGRHLVRQGRGICSPLVEVEVCGIDADWAKFRTSTQSKSFHIPIPEDYVILHCNFLFTKVYIPIPEDNGFNPVWNEGCEFDIVNSDLALLRFAVQDEDVFGDPNFIGQAVCPLACIKTGFSSVQLKNMYNEDLELSCLLVHIDIRKTYDEDEEIYTTAR